MQQEQSQVLQSNYHNPSLLWHMMVGMCTLILIAKFAETQWIRTARQPVSFIGGALSYLFIAICAYVVALVACEIALITIRTSQGICWLIGQKSEFFCWLVVGEKSEATCWLIGDNSIFWWKLSCFFIISPLGATAAFACTMYVVCVLQLVSQKIAGFFGEASLLYTLISHVLFDWMVIFFDKWVEIVIYWSMTMVIILTIFALQGFYRAVCIAFAASSVIYDATYSFSLVANFMCSYWRFQGGHINTSAYCNIPMVISAAHHCQEHFHISCMCVCIVGVACLIIKGYEIMDFVAGIYASTNNFLTNLPRTTCAKVASLLPAHVPYNEKSIVDMNTLRAFITWCVRIQLYAVVAGLNSDMYKLDGFLKGSVVW
jgi:hypothetical protein